MYVLVSFFVLIFLLMVFWIEDAFIVVVFSVFFSSAIRISVRFLQLGPRYFWSQIFVDVVGFEVGDCTVVCVLLLDLLHCVSFLLRGFGYIAFALSVMVDGWS